MVLINLRCFEASGQDFRNQLPGLQCISNVIIICDRNDLDFTRELLALGVADELVSNIIYNNHVKHELVSANTVTERITYLQEIEPPSAGLRK